MTPIGNCPWPGCGGAASTHDLDPGGWRDGEWCVECDRCNARSPTMPTEAAAIAAWNKLAGPDVVTGRLRMYRDFRTFLIGNLPVGETAPRREGVWAWKISGGKWEDAEDEFEARAALIEAVRKAMGGGE